MFVLSIGVCFVDDWVVDRIREPASAFKARGTPEVLRIIEIMTINQSRTWGVCNLNEFRKVSDVFVRRRC